MIGNLEENNSISGRMCCIGRALHFSPHQWAELRQSNPWPFEQDIFLKKKERIRCLTQV